MIDWLARRAPRERLLLGLLVALVLPAAIWLGGLAPLFERRAAAEAALAEARALDAWVAARAGEMAALGPVTEAAQGAPIGSAGLEQSLIAAGLRPAVSDLAGDGAGAVTLRFEAVEFRALMVWLTASDPGWGYVIERLRLRAGDRPGLVRADLALRPAG